MYRELQKESVLKDVAALVGTTREREVLFHDDRQFLGFRIRWLRPELAAEICGRHGVNPKSCELIFMTATGLTKCHRHDVGETVFLTLGAGHGLPEPKGGVLMAKDTGQPEITLRPHHQTEGEIIVVAPGMVHAFFADEGGGELNALGFVFPRIRTAQEEFDAIPYDVVRQHPYVVRAVRQDDGDGGPGQFCEW